MKKLYLSFLPLILLSATGFGQSDNCSTASLIGVTANCASPTNGTTIGATASISGCVGNADDDVWYKFVASGTSHQITVTPSATMDPVVELFSGTCASLVSLNCQDNGLDGVAETINATGLTNGVTYTIRIFHYYAGAGSGTFTICVTNPPPAPANNICGSAVNLTVNVACSYTAGTTVGATQSYAGCSGTADDDVWYKFTATNSTATITLDPSISMDAVLQLYSGACATLNSIQCEDAGFSNDNEVINAVGLTAGTVYYFRVYDYYSGNGGYPFNVCVTGPPASGTPTNDEPCTAIALPAVTSDCNYLQFTTTGSTASMGAPTPATCAGGSGAAIGGFSATSHDVWFSVVAPASGQLAFTPQPSYGIGDAVMALYSGACGALTQIACSDDNTAYPGSANDTKPFISKTGLTPGTTYYLRYWGFGSTSGNFGLCVLSTTNDACSNSLYICDLNGYSASTSAAYTPDRPGNMFGDGETAAGASTLGVNSGGVFGQGGAWGTGSPAFDVMIEGNSWLRFTAAATTVVLNVTIGNCWVGSYPSGGIQMQIFSGNNCTAFVPVSDFKEGSSGFTITANNLTIGNTYYLMIDGYAKDICNYTITANSGVLFPDITTTATPICTGNSTTLTGPAGASSYDWSPGGQTTPSITISPSTTTTYTCIVSGVCGAKQTLTKTITVNQLPVMTSSASTTSCSGLNVSIALSASPASSFTWIATDNVNTSGESTTTQSSGTLSNTITNNTVSSQVVTYTVTPTSTAGSCAGTPQTINITVNPLPTTSASGLDQGVCSSTATLAGNSPSVGTGVWTLISGSGIITSSASPNSGLTGLGTGANVFQWTISNAPCAPSTSQVTITGVAAPTVSAAGSDQSVCTTSATLAGNTATVGTGLWTLISGSGTITTPSSPNSGVTGLGAGANVFQWTISNAPCASSFSQVTITNSGGPPTTSVAGSNQGVCSTTATLAGNTPALGTGLWTLVSGSGSITSPSVPNSGVTGLGTGANVFQWTISNAPCAPSTSQVTITGVAAPTVSAAGSDQSVCTTSATLAGNTATVGTGLWTLISGSGTITTPSSPNSGVTGLGAGANVFQWTISNAPCASSFSQVTITNSGGPPTTSVAGSNQDVCSTTATLAGNTPALGTGLWSLVSGTGIITSPSLPNSGVSGLGTGANVFQWTISNAPCAPSISQVTITGVAAPTASVAGPDQTLCSTSAIFAGNTPTVGTGLWTLISGSGIITTPTSPNSGVTGLGAGANVFQWTISNSPCSSSSSQLTITITGGPTTAIAGSDQGVCSTTATLAGNTPTVGTGLWTLISGSGTITSPSSPNSGVSGLGAGANVFQWTISNAPCAPSSSQVTITGIAVPTVSSAGSDQTLCSTSATLAGNTPTIGTGLWTLVSGSGIITTPTSPNSGVTGLGAGANVFQWTISNSPCSSSSSQLTITNTGGPTTALAGSDQGVCSTTATLAGNTPTVGTGLWTLISGSGIITSPSSPNSGVSGLGAGANVFQWTISNAPCTPSSSQVTITGVDIPTVSVAGSDQTICNTSATLAGNTPTVGTGIWTLVSGSGTITSVSSPSSTVTGLGVGANVFQWTISNPPCSSSSSQLTITNTGGPTTAVAGSDQSICFTTATLAGNTPTVGTGLWTLISGSGIITSPSSPNSGVSGLGIGANVFQWTISNAPCTASFSQVAITVNSLPDITTLPTSVPSNCGGSTGALTGIVVNGSGSLNYSWTNSVNTVVGTSSDLSNQPAGTYNLTVTDANGCFTVFGPFSIINPGAPTAPTVVANSNSVCVGGSILLNASSGFPNPIFNWTGPDTSSNLATLTIPSATLADSGPYAVSVTSNGCTGPATIVIVTVNANPVATASSTTSTLCSGNTIDLSGTGIGNPSWSGPNAFTSSNLNETITNATIAASGIYTLVVTNAANCKDSASIAITVDPTPAEPGTTANSNNLCEGDSLQLNAISDPGSSYSWSGPNGYTSSSQDTIINPVSISNSGTYSVTATLGMCTSSSALVSITINANPVTTASSTTSTICSGNTIDLSGTGVGNPNWSGPNAFTSSNLNETITNATIAASGIYTLVVTNAANCKDSASIAITVDPTPSAPGTTANSNNLCEGDSLQLNATSDPGSNYSWSGPNGFISSSQDTVINPVSILNSGTYSVTATLGSCTSASALIQITVNANPITTASSTTSTVCSGSTINLNGTGVGNYNWTGPNGFTSTNASEMIANATTAASGVYNLSVTGAGSCIDTASVIISVNQSPQAPITFDASTCTGTPLILSATATGTVDWYSDAALTNLVQANSATYSPVISSGTSATYYVTLTNNGCTSSPSTVTANYANINADATVSDSTGFTPISVNFTNLSTGVDAGDNFLWLFGDGNSANTFNASNEYTVGGNYNVMLIITETASGCIDTAYIRVNYDGESYLIIPNIFTPNNDHTNDLFKVISKGINTLDAEIYDRWGIKLVEWHSVNGGWDGRSTSGVPASDATYFYIIKAKAYNGKEYLEKGPFQLIR